MHSLVESNRTKICDSCEDEIHQEIPLFSCFVCDYDLCEKCASPAAPDVSSGSAKKSAPKKSVSESKPSDKSGKFNKGKDLQSSSSFMCSFMGFGDTDAFDAVRLVREYLHDFLPDFEVEVVGFYKSGVGIRIWQAEVESLKAEFGKNRSSFMFQGTPLNLVDVKPADLKKFTMPKPSVASSSASTSASAPVAPAPSGHTVSHIGLRGSPFRKLARTRPVSELPPDSVPDLPAFADVVAPAHLSPPAVETVDLNAIYEFMKTNMATKTDIAQLQVNIENRTKTYVDSAISAVTQEFATTTQAVVDLCDRVDKLEIADRRRATSVPPSLGSRKFDVAFKQIAFKKIAEGISPEKRIQDIEAFMQKNFANVRVKDCFNIRTGPFPKDRSEERALSRVCIVEVSNSDIQRAVLQKIKTLNLKCVVGGKEVETKPAMTAAASARNSALRRAEKVLKEDTVIDANAVKCEFTGSRGVTVAGVYAFTQGTGDTLGEFVKPYERFVLPP